MALIFLVSELFECDGESFISPYFLCDGRDDCEDRKDEENCKSTQIAENGLKKSLL